MARSQAGGRQRPVLVFVLLIAALTVLPAAGRAERVHSLASGESSADKPDPASDIIPGRYVVSYDESVASVGAETDRQERANEFRATLRFRHALKGFAASLNAIQVRDLRADPDVAAVVPDRTVRALGYVPLASGDSAPTGVRRILAASPTTAREASDAGVAVIDTGIDLDHPDLNAISAKDCVNPGTSADDDEGHGTHVAGTIGAENGGAGVVGVAPGTELYAVKVLDEEGSGSWSQVICGIDWVTSTRTDADPSNDIAVANMSLGGRGKNDYSCGATNGDLLHQAICRSTNAGVTHVVAAGNRERDIGDAPPDVPASYPEVLTVAAMSDSDGRGGGIGADPSCPGSEGEDDDAHASFSNFASRPADIAHMIAAPGVCIRSTVPGGYGTASGTSMATPHAAGAVALCLSEAGVAGPCAGKTPAEIISYIRAQAEAKATADPSYGFAGDPSLPNSSGDYFGYLAIAGADAQPAPPEPPPSGETGESGTQPLPAPAGEGTSSGEAPSGAEGPAGTDTPVSEDPEGATPSAIPLLAQRRILTVRNETVAVRLECGNPAGCAGTALLRPKPERARRSILRLGALRALTLGRTRYALAAGQPTRVRIRLTRTGRSLVRRQRKVDATLILRGAVGGHGRIDVRLRTAR